jgi:hypothetical protein
MEIGHDKGLVTDAATDAAPHSPQDVGHQRGIMKHITNISVFCFCFCFLLFAIASADETKGDNVTVSLSKNVVLKMRSKPVIQKNHKIATCKILDQMGICLVDRKPVFGTDWETPKSQLIEAMVVIDGGTLVKLDVSCMYNPWAGQPQKKNFAVTTVEGGLVVHGEFSDGAGSYVAEWLIVDGSSVRTKLEKDVD